MNEYMNLLCVYPVLEVVLSAVQYPSGVMPKVIEIGSGQGQNYNPDLSPELSLMLH